MDRLQPRPNHQFNPFEPHPELDDVDTSRMNKIDYNNDSDLFGMFSGRGLSPPKVLRPLEARVEAASRTRSIFANHSLLRGIINRHEAVIQRRWEKKGAKQRLAVLLTAWGQDMPATHRPDFKAWRLWGSRIGQMPAELKAGFVWPYVNREDLVKKEALLLLLNARGRNHPSVFAAADCEAAHLGRVTMAVVPIFLNEHVMIMNGVTDEKDYGRLVSWNEDEAAFDWMHSRKQPIPGEALLTLEIQDRLLAFLVDCCRQILHDVPASALLDDALHPVQPEPPRLSHTAELAAGGSGSGFASLTAMAEEAPYRVPADLDLGRIESLLAARQAAAEDHAWQLREDPGYFSDSLYEMREHRLEMLKDVQGAAHPATKPLREGTLWARVLGSTLFNAHFELELFAELHAQAANLRTLRRKYAADIVPGKDLPEPYLAAVLKFRHYLNQVAKGPMAHLKETFPASPPMRNYFVREVPDSPISSKIRAMSRPGVKKDPLTIQLLWLLQTIWEDGRDLFFLRLPTAVDELQRLLEAEPKAKELVTPYVARLISDLAIVAECVRQLDLYQPWANVFEDQLVKREEGLKNEYAQRMAGEAKVMAALSDGNIATGPIRSLGDPSDKKFEYSVAKRRSRDNVEQLRKAEAALDAVWAAVDKLVREKAGSLQGTATDRLLRLEARELLRTGEWVEPAAAKKKTSPAATDGISSGISSLHLGQQPEPTSARREALAAAASSKPKPKTRGDPSATTTSAPAPAQQPTADDAQPLFRVSLRALKVFRIVFFDPSANTTPGELAWTDFLHALSETGFTAQKLYGSVWHFQPTTLDVERSIQFHEPHPRGKIPFVMARRHGRRLARAYGWSGGMFVEGKRGKE